MHQVHKFTCKLTFGMVAVQLTQKKTTLQFKALDQTLQTINRDTNKKEALSYRCADMDRIVPSLMGVSKVQQWLALSSRLWWKYAPMI